MGAAASLELDRPLLRGWFHLVAFFLAVPAGALLLGVSGTTTARLAAVVYTAAVAIMFGVSACYHRGRWGATARLRMQRLDHATIFVMIAGSYTPFCLLVLDGAVAAVLLVAVWVGAVIGVVMALTGLAERRILGLASYLALGWIALAALPQLVHHLGGGGFVLLVAGGAAYTLGAIGLALHWPDPFPRVFGYHEVWHAMVLAAVVCHYIVILSVLRVWRHCVDGVGRESLSDTASSRRWSRRQRRSAGRLRRRSRASRRLAAAQAAWRRGIDLTGAGAVVPDRRLPAKTMTRRRADLETLGEGTVSHSGGSASSNRNSIHSSMRMAPGSAANRGSDRSPRPR